MFETKPFYASSTWWLFFVLATGTFTLSVMSFAGHSNLIPLQDAAMGLISSSFIFSYLVGYALSDFFLS